MSWFKTKQGSYVYGKLRRTDFLPVGDEREDEILERGLLSASSDSSSLTSRMEEAGMTYGEGEPLEGSIDFD